MTTEGRWDLPPSDLRVRLAVALEAWAPGGIECYHLDEMDVLLEELDKAGVHVQVLNRAESRRYLGRDGDHFLVHDVETDDWPYICTCERWAHHGGSRSEARASWREHIAREQDAAESA